MADSEEPDINVFHNKPSMGYTRGKPGQDSKSTDERPPQRSAEELDQEDREAAQEAREAAWEYHRESLQPESLGWRDGRRGDPEAGPATKALCWVGLSIWTLTLLVPASCFLFLFILVIYSLFKNLLPGA